MISKMLARVLTIGVLFLPNGRLQNAEMEALKHAKARIHLVLMHYSGRDMGEGQVQSFKSKSDGKEFAHRFSKNLASDIPYGSYKLVAYQVGSFSVTRDIDVYSPDVWVVVSPQFGDELPAVPAPNHTIKGKIDHVDHPEDLIYVKLVGLYALYTLDAKLSVSGDSGTYEMAGRIPEGDYFLLFTGSSGLLCVRKIRVELGKSDEHSYSNASCSMHFPSQ